MVYTGFLAFWPGGQKYRHAENEKRRI